MERPIGVSGADKHFFAMDYLLMHSLAQWAPDPEVFRNPALRDCQVRALTRYAWCRNRRTSGDYRYSKAL